MTAQALHLDHVSGSDFFLWSGCSAGAVFCDRVFLLPSGRSAGAVHYACGCLLWSRRSAGAVLFRHSALPECLG
eukprot:7182506-Alexandrium_andersonii.AAC.1